MSHYKQQFPTALRHPASETPCPASPEHGAPGTEVARRLRMGGTSLAVPPLPDDCLGAGRHRAQVVAVIHPVWATADPTGAVLVSVALPAAGQESAVALGAWRSTRR